MNSAVQLRSRERLVVIHSPSKPKPRVFEYVVIELTNCFDGQKLKPWADEIYKSYFGIGCYAEFSPSGGGLRIIFRGQTTAHHRTINKLTGEELEIYMGEPLTGDLYRMDHTPLEEQDPKTFLWKLTRFHFKFFPPDEIPFDVEPDPADEAKAAWLALVDEQTSRVGISNDTHKHEDLYLALGKLFAERKLK